MKKDVLGLRNVKKEEIEQILATAAEMKQKLQNDEKKLPYLAGKSVVTLFYENSTRTRMSFELASKYMSASAANISAGASSVQKGDTLIDTGCTLDQMGTDVIIIRHPMSGAARLLAGHTRASVINAGDGMNEHPTQALLDMLTMKQVFGSLEGLTVAIVGDVQHSRVARSNYWGLTTMGAKVKMAAPETLIPADMRALGVDITSDLSYALKDADVVMGLRMQKERQQAGLVPSYREYSRFFGINEQTMQLAKPHAIVLHPGPLNRGVEMTTAVADGPQSYIREQVTNGVAVRMALLYLLTREEQR